MNILIRSMIYFIAFFFIALPLWVNKYFGTASVDQLLLTLKFGFSGVLTSDPIFVKRFIKWCLLGPIALTTILIFIEILPSYIRYRVINAKQKTIFNKRSSAL